MVRRRSRAAGLGDLGTSTSTCTSTPSTVDWLAAKVRILEGRTSQLVQQIDLLTASPQPQLAPSAAAHHHPRPEHYDIAAGDHTIDNEYGDWGPELFEGHLIVDEFLTQLKTDFGEHEGNYEKKESFGEKEESFGEHGNGVKVDDFGNVGDAEGHSAEENFGKFGHSCAKDNFGEHEGNGAKEESFGEKEENFGEQGNGVDDVGNFGDAEGHSAEENFGKFGHSSAKDNFGEHEGNGAKEESFGEKEESFGEQGNGLKVDDFGNFGDAEGHSAEENFGKFGHSCAKDNFGEHEGNGAKEESFGEHVGNGTKVDDFSNFRDHEGHGAEENLGKLRRDSALENFGEFEGSGAKAENFDVLGCSAAEELFCDLSRTEVGMFESAAASANDQGTLDALEELMSERLQKLGQMILEYGMEGRKAPTTWSDLEEYQERWSTAVQWRRRCLRNFVLERSHAV